MINFISKLRRWFFNRIPKNTTGTQAFQNPVQEIPNATTIPADIQPIESCAETDSIIGTSFKVGLFEKAFKSDGQLVRAHENLSAVVGCGHLIHQLQATDGKDKHVIGIMGQCSSCVSELEQLHKKGKINRFDAERLAFVCTDCAQITDSGELCCPRHYRTVSNSDGTKTYLSSEDIKEQKRQDTLQLAKNSITMLFGLNNPSEEQTNE